MTIIHRVISVLVLTLFLGCGGQSTDSGNSREIDVAVINAATVFYSPQSFVRNYGVNDTSRLFAFVGEKILVEQIPHDRGSMDKIFKAKYRILKKVYGSFAQDTIEFVVYDHYGTPYFSEFRNVLLYVSADSGTYYHQKYMYNAVYKTKDGRWAGMYAIDDYEHPYNKNTGIKPVKIDFADRIAFPANEGYPRPYFKTVGDSSVPVYGNYVEELFALKKAGFLTQRQLFKATPEQEEYMVESYQPEPPKTPPTADDLKFLAFWKTFVSSVKQPGLKNFRSIALDTLEVCSKFLSTDYFINNCFAEIIDEEVLKRINDKTKLEYTSSDVEFFNLFIVAARKEIVKIDDSYRFRQMLVTRGTKNNNPPTVVFNFIETKKGYRLYGIDHYWSKECCE